MAPYKFLSNMSVVLDSVCAHVIIITGNTDRIVCPSKRVRTVNIDVSMHFFNDIKPALYSALLWIIKSAFVQVKLTNELIKARKDIDVVLFYQIFPYYLLPLLASKALGKHTIEYRGQAKPSTLSVSTLYPKILSVQEPLMCILLDGISLESSGLLESRSLRLCRHKLLPTLRFVDLSRYVLNKPLDERKKLIGFVGRLTRDKGVIDFVKAIPTIAQQNAGASFLIAGAGDQSEWVVDECMKLRADGYHVTASGWIGEDLPECLNELKLLILPTRYDAFPTILVEAIACGTPVVATAVGGIPDFVKDGETGFLLVSGEAECITEAVTKALALSDTELGRIAENAKMAVEPQFSYSATVERFRAVFSLTPPQGVEMTHV
jgi:glycosyltransferase involved in cell wall biosynthesis